MADRRSPAAEETAEDLERTLEDIEYTGRKHGPRLGLVISLIAAAWSLFQLWMASPLPFIFGFGIIVDVPARGIHLAFGLVLCFLLFPAAKSLASRRLPVYDVVTALLASGCALYLFFGYRGLVSRQGILWTWDVAGFTFPFEAILGGVGILLLLEATRRSIGLPLVIVASVFLVYSVFGQSMPDIISHKGVSLNRLIGYQWLGGESIFGIPIDVSVSFVFLFVLFGAILDKVGAGKYFLDLAFAMVGKYRGGPAKAAILASGMTGLISGSSIANVVTTGTFTIPVMIRTGLPAIKAGAIEVAASTNGQIMPPIMGAAAFIIAELIGISYLEVIKAAFIPAVISYMALMYISHLEALKLGLRGLPRSEIPPFRETFMGGIHFLVPIAVLIYLLMVEKWTAGSAVFYSILLMMIVIMAQRTTPKDLGNGVLGVVYGIPVVVLVVLRILGYTMTESLGWSYLVTLVIVLALALWGTRDDAASVREGFKLGVADIYGGMVAGARNMMGIAVAVATAGIIVGSVSSTGLNNAMVGVVEAISGGNVYVLLVLTAVLCLVLGMGLPTTANYLVVASLLAGVVVELGGAAGLVLPLIAVHLFVFYFGLMADSTPPVCLAAFAAAAISRADPLKTGVQSFLYDIRTAILPFVFIFNPELLLIGVDSFWHGLLILLVSLVAIFCFSSVTQGWLVVKVRIHEALLLLVVTVALFRPGLILDQFYPAFRPLALGEFIGGEARAKPGYGVRFHVVRHTDYGDRFKLFRIGTPELVGADLEELYGVKLEASEGDSYEVADLMADGLAEQIGLELGDEVTAVDVEQAGLPAKEWVYPFALLLLALVIALQMVRWRRETTAPAVAPRE